MPFNSSRYLVFIAVVFFVYWGLAGPQRRSLRLWFLLGASCLFYAVSSWKFLGLLLGFGLVNFYAGIRIETSAGRAKKLWCAAAVVLSLSTLAVYKYLDFFGQSLDAGLRLLGVSAEVPLAGLALPLGISFYTFQSVAYAVDVYRGKSPASRSLRDYALYLAFFPKLASGPIARPGQLLPLFGSDPVYDHDRVFRGLYRIFFGLFKKVMVADLLASYLVNNVYQDPMHASLPVAWLTMWAYAIQIYCDFSGYTDMALGSAELLGITLPENFNRPYLAPNPQEFWRRWHMTLSNWLRDYLYISLGGSRHGAARTYLALFLTMLLGGLWHGSAWTFVFWGAFHGLMLMIHRWWQESHKGKTAGPDSPLGHWARVFLTFNLVSLAWIFFRAPDLGTATGLISRLFVGDLTLAGIPKRALLVLALGVALHNSIDWRDRVGGFFVRLHPVLQGVLFILAVALFQLLGSVSEPFIYFRF